MPPSPNGNQTEHFYYQGDIACRPASPTSQDPNCPFNALRDRDFLKGDEYRTIVHNPEGQKLSETQRSYTVEFYDMGQDPQAPMHGLWHAFSYQNQQVDTI